MKIKCELCGRQFDRLDVHLHFRHQTTVKDYQARFPGAPVMSDTAKQNASQAQKAKVATPTQSAPSQLPNIPVGNPADRPFQIGNVQLFPKKDGELDPVLDKPFVPDHDENWEMGQSTMELWEVMALAIQNADNVMLTGPTGCGKTSGVEQMASALNQPRQRMNMDGDIRKSDFVGKNVLVKDEATGQTVTKWQDGILPTAMRRGHWLILDELDAAPSQILLTLQAVLDGGRKLVLTDNGGEVIKAHPDFRVFATANTKGRGDESGMYQGTNVLNEATLDRFAVMMDVGYPEEQVERRIVERKAKVPAQLADRMVRVAKSIREAVSNDQCMVTFSTRKLINWASMARRMAGNQNINATHILRAAKATVTNRLNKDDRAFVEGVISRYFGNEVK